MRPRRLLTARPVLTLYRWLLPVSALLTLTGYFRPWITHQAAGLAVLGLDFGELVKFLYPVQQGDIRLWREGFYLPLVSVSVSLSLNAFRRDAVHPQADSSSSPIQDVVRNRPAYRWPVRRCGARGCCGPGWARRWTIWSATSWTRWRRGSFPVRCCPGGPPPGMSTATWAAITSRSPCSRRVASVSSSAG